MYRVIDTTALAARARYDRGLQYSTPRGASGARHGRRRVPRDVRRQLAARAGSRGVPPRGRRDARRAPAASGAGEPVHHWLSRGQSADATARMTIGVWL